MGYGQKWRFGCDKEMEVTIPRGYSYRNVTVRCGSTAFDGGVNQCDECAEKSGSLPTPDEDESDMDWYERATGGDE